MAAETGKQKKVALALSSGGPRGFAYIGAIEELESRGYVISSIARCRKTSGSETVAFRPRCMESIHTHGHLHQSEPSGERGQGNRSPQGNRSGHEYRRPEDTL